MRKFLFALCLSVIPPLAGAAEPPALAALDAFRAPMEAIVTEAGKGRQTDFEAIGKAGAEVGKAWQAFAGEPLDLDRFGVPAAKHEEAWRRVRMLAMLVRYLEESLARGDRALTLRAAGMLPQAYAELRAALENR